MSAPKTRTIQVTIEADARPALKALARLEMAFWTRRYDPNPFPRFRPFRWLP